MSQEKIFIHQAAQETPIVGILQRAQPGESTQRRQLALIIHGVAAHKDQIYHKRLANTLVERRGLDSFRYDLRAQGGESGGKWGMMNLGDDVTDLEVVVAHLTNKLGYDIHCIIAHSRGSMLSAYYLSCFPNRPRIPLFVNLSGRYNMTRILKDKRYIGLRNASGDDYDKEAVVYWRPRVAGQTLNLRITWQGLAQFAEWDNAYVQSSFPPDVHVLTIHGDADEVVPVEDAYTYHRIFSNRQGSGTSTLKIAPGHGHNYLKPYDEPVNSIMDWLDVVDPVAGQPRIGSGNGNEEGNWNGEGQEGGAKFGGGGGGTRGEDEVELQGCSPRGGKPRL